MFPLLSKSYLNYLELETIAQYSTNEEVEGECPNYTDPLTKLRQGKDLLVYYYFVFSFSKSLKTLSQSLQNNPTSTITPTYEWLFSYWRQCVLLLYVRTCLFIMTSASQCQGWSLWRSGLSYGLCNVCPISKPYPRYCYYIWHKISSISLYLC